MRYMLPLVFCLMLPLAKATEVAIPAGDGFYLKGELAAPDSDRAVLLLHQCNRDQTMWQPLLAGLLKADFSWMTVDFRGYGKSKSKEFNVDGTDEDYLRATAHLQSDVVAIYRHWVEHTPNARKRVIVGASCGGGGASCTMPYLPALPMK